MKGVIESWTAGDRGMDVLSEMWTFIRRDGAEWKKLSGICEKWILHGCWSEGGAALMNRVVNGSHVSLSATLLRKVRGRG